MFGLVSYKMIHFFWGGGGKQLKNSPATTPPKEVTPPARLMQEGRSDGSVGSDGHGIGWKLADQPSRYLPPRNLT